jgi:hypothetical protein
LTKTRLRNLARTSCDEEIDPALEAALVWLIAAFGDDRTNLETLSEIDAFIHECWGRFKPEIIESKFVEFLFAQFESPSLGFEPTVLSLLDKLTFWAPIAALLFDLRLVPLLGQCLETVMHQPCTDQVLNALAHLVPQIIDHSTAGLLPWEAIRSCHSPHGILHILLRCLKFDGATGFVPLYISPCRDLINTLDLTNENVSHLFLFLAYAVDRSPSDD